MTDPEERDVGEMYADLFCISAEVQEILDRHRKPRDLDDPAYWNTAKQRALADWKAGRVPIWRRIDDDGKQVFFGYENDPAACRRRDEFDARQRTAIKRSNRPNEQGRRKGLQ